MTLTSGIKALQRFDAQVLVKVPATRDHKAYTYMRESSANPSAPKPSGGKRVLVAAGVGAIAGGALTLGVLALRKTKKGEEPKNLLNGDNPIDADSREVSNGIKGDNPIDADSREVSNGIKGSSGTSSLPEGRSKKKPLITPPPVSNRDRVAEAQQQAQDEMTDKEHGLMDRRQNLRYEREKSKDLGLTGKFATAEIKRKESSKKVADLESKNEGLLTKGINTVKKIAKAGVERDRKAGGAFAQREVDLNKAAYTTGQKAQSVVQKTVAVAKSVKESLGKKQPKAVDVKATEVNAVLPEGKSIKKVPKPKSSKGKLPTAAEKRAIQKKLNDIN